MPLRENLSNLVVNLKSMLRPISASDLIEHQNDIMKGMMPRWIYRPPFGYPRMVNLAYLRRMAKSSYVFMMINTIVDQVASMEWEIQPVDKERANSPETQAHIEEVTEFFNNPNVNNESFEMIRRKGTRDILEVEAGIIVKIFNKKGKLTGLMTYDGATFTKNPDIHGSYLDRDDFCFTDKLGPNAAYYQYGWHTPVGTAIPFGKREIVWLERNMRTDSYYAYSPVEALADIIQTLIYGSTWQLDYFIKNEIPTGIISLVGSNANNIKAFKEKFRRQLLYTDKYGDKVRQFHTIPIVNEEIKFTQLQFDANQLRLIESQDWFVRIAAACFGTTMSELGFTAAENRATDLSQSRVHKRKAIRPLLTIWEYAMNDQVIPEFGYDDIKFAFVMEDLEEETVKAHLFETQIRNKILTPNEAREKLGMEPLEGGNELWSASPFMRPGFGLSRPNPFPETEKEEIEKVEEQQKSKPETKIFRITPEEDLPKDGIDKILKDFLSRKEKEILSQVTDEMRDGNIRNIKSLGKLVHKIKEAVTIEEIKEIIIKAVRKQFETGLEKAEKEMEMNFVINNHVLDYLGKYTFENIKDMTDDIGKKLRGEFERAIMNGEGITMVKKRVQGVFDVIESRAEAIARTEMTRVNNMGSLDGYKQSGMRGKKVWLAAKDERTTELCRRLDGQKVGLDEYFVDKVTGNKFLSPPAHVNCRSTIFFEVE